MDLQPQSELTRGVLLELLNGDVPENDPVLQLVSYRCLDESNGELVQRLTLSDGLHSTAFAVTGGDLIEKESLKPFSIFQLLKYECVKVYSDKKTRTVLLIHDLNFVSQHSKIIGDPKDIDAPFAAVNEVANLQPAQLPTPQTPPPPVEEHKTWTLKPLYPNLELTKALQKPPPGRIFKVSELKDGSCPRNVTIRVKVMNKLPVKALSFRGQVINIELADDTGMIPACAFDSECDKFKHIFEVGHVYWVEGGHVRLSRESKRKVKNSFELILHRETNVIECYDTSGLPSIDFNFTPLNNIHLQDKQSFVDICGICVSASDLYIHNGSVNHRMVVIISPSVGNNKQVEIDIWGKYAEEFDASSNPVVVIKNCKISNQRDSAMRTFLYLDPSSIFLVDPPNCPIVKPLKNWYADFVAKQMATKITTAEEVPIAKNVKDVVEAASFTEAKSRLEALTDKVVYLKSLVTVIETDPQYNMTLNCTTCRRQVFDLNLEKLVCSTCGYVDGADIRSLFTKIRIGDEITSEWATIADVQLRKALGITSTFMEGNSTQLWEALCSLVNKKFYVQLKYDR
ncbi:hypothetical protein B566_EDAN002500, partial [Ephemera danica]